MIFLNKAEIYANLNGGSFSVAGEPDLGRQAKRMLFTHERKHKAPSSEILGGLKS